MYKHKVLFVIKLALVLILGYVVITTVLMPQRIGEIFVPNSAVGTENGGSVETTNPPGIPIEDCSAIIERNMFAGQPSSLGASDLMLGEHAGGPARSAGEELGLVLLGTVTGSPAVSRAIIRDVETNELGLYKTGDTVATAHIESIEQDVVVLLLQGQRKILNFGNKESKQREADNSRAALPKDSTQPVEKATRTSLLKSCTDVGAKLKHIETVVEKAVIQPYVVDGRTEGLRITGLENIPAAKDVGLRNGDVIRVVNGHRLTSKQKAFQILKKARSQAAMTMDLLRDNKTETLSFSLR